MSISTENSSHNHRGDVLEDFQMQYAIDSSRIEDTIGTSNADEDGSSRHGEIYEIRKEKEFNAEEYFEGNDDEMVFYDLKFVKEERDLKIKPEVDEDELVTSSIVVSSLLVVGNRKEKNKEITEEDCDEGNENDYNLFLLLPNDMHIYIYSFLGPFYLCRLECVCKELYRSIHSNDIVWEPWYIMTRYLIRPQVDGITPDNMKLKFKKGISSWMDMLKIRPRVRLDGIYTITEEYIKSGMPEMWEEETVSKGFLEVTYWRSIRFLPHGKLMYIMHVKPPKLIHKWFREDFVSKQKEKLLEKGTYVLKGNLVICSINRVDGYIMHFQFRVNHSAVARESLIINSRCPQPIGKGGRWNRLVLTAHSTREPYQTLDEAYSHLSSDPKVYHFKRYHSFGII